jgi:Fe-S cluster assembly protein SufD
VSGGVHLLPLDQAAREYPDIVRPHLAQAAGLDINAFATLNLALFRSGAFVHVQDALDLDRPIHLVFVSSGAAGPLPASHPRALVVAAPGSRAAVVESYLSVDDRPSLSNAVIEIVLGENAHIEHTKLLLENEAAYHIGTTRVRAGRASEYASFSLSVGDTLARNQLDVLLDAEGAACTLDGLYVPSGTQHIDNHSMIDHRVPHTTSRQLYKGVLADRAHAVFNGKVVVRPGAQKTDAQQTNRNLLISDNAVIDTKPQLEILADDVKCSHGATVGQLDEDAYFYLLSRGISALRARALLTYGFASDVLERVHLEPLRACLTTLLLERLEPEASVELAAGEVGSADTGQIPAEDGR